MRRLLKDVNTPSAHGLEISKACNRYQVHSVTRVYPSKISNECFLRETCEKQVSGTTFTKHLIVLTEIEIHSSTVAVQ